MDEIFDLDDETAIRVLETITRGQAHGETIGLKEATQLSTTWREVVGDVGSDDAPATDGDLARAALAWMATDPQQRKAIEAVIANPAPPRYGVASLGALLAVLLVLKTKGIVEYKNGKWRIKVELVELKEGPLKIVFDLFAKLSLSVT
jgi:hypothetical protein